MKKTFNIYSICWTILLVLFNLVAFLIPNEVAGISKSSGGFWIGYISVTVAFVGQLVCAHYAFRQENLQKFFYNVSLIAISYSATFLTIVVGALCMVILVVPAWIGAIVCLLALGFSAISVLKAKAAADIVDEIDRKIKVQTFFIKSLTMDMESLMPRAQSEEIKTELRKVYETIRYSDPMSSDALTNIEAQITLKLDSLPKSVESGDIEGVRAKVDELMILLNDRNKKCKLLK